MRRTSTHRRTGSTPGDAGTAARLSHATVLVVGTGALGSAAVLTLAEAGIGRLVLLDPDLVELSNLHRQPLHATSRLGMSKVASAAAFLKSRYPNLAVDPREVRLEPANLEQYFAAADFIIDATDGVASKFILNDGAVLTGRPLSHAGVLGFQGQTMTVQAGESACYRCLFPEAPVVGEIPSCQEAGILGPVAGVIGSIQATEAIRHLLGLRPALLGRLLTYDGLSGRWRRIEIQRNPRCPLCGKHPTITALDAAHEARYGS